MAGDLIRIWIVAAEFNSGFLARTASKDKAVPHVYFDPSGERIGGEMKKGHRPIEY